MKHTVDMVLGRGRHGFFLAFVRLLFIDLRTCELWYVLKMPLPMRVLNAPGNASSIRKRDRLEV